MSEAKYWAFGDKFAGITSKGKRFVVDTLAAAKSKLGKKSSTTPKSKASNPKPKKRGTSTAKNKGKGGGRKLFGSVGPKGLLIGVIGMSLVKIGLRRFAPMIPEKYVDPIGMISIGAIGKVIDLPTKNLLPAGIITGGSTLISDLVMGQIPMVRGANSGYDV